MHGWDQLCDVTLSFKHAESYAVLELWQSLKGDRDMPARTDMTARRLKPYITRVALCERVQTDPPVYRWRLMGTRITQSLGEHTGETFEESGAPLQAARWTASHELVLATRCPIRCIGRAFVNEREHLFSELLFLPLTDDAGEARFVMGFGIYGPDYGWAAESRRIIESDAGI